MAESLNVLQRLIAARKDVGYVQKNQKKIDGKYTAVMYSDVITAVRKALIDHGILDVVRVLPGWTVEPAQTKSGDPLTRLQCTIETTFYNVDNPQDFVAYSNPSFGLDSGDKGGGKARTYGAKGNLLQAFLMVSGDDEEARAELIGVESGLSPEFVNATEAAIKAAASEKDIMPLLKTAKKELVERAGKFEGHPDWVRLVNAASLRKGELKAPAAPTPEREPGQEG